MNRKGEKIGWIGGWHGGFIWLGALSVVWLFQNRIYYGIIGMAIFMVASIAIIAAAPWKHPNTKYWKLMLPIYFLFFISIAFYIFSYGGLESTGMKWTSFFWVVPCLIPIVTTGGRTWKENA
jgi:hypothetical protein